MKKVLLFLLISLSVLSCKKQKNATGVLPDGYSDQAIGMSAHDLLSNARYTTINLQVQYMPGYKLEPETINNLKDFIATLCNKPGGINITETEIPSSGDDTLTVNEIAVIEKKNRTAYTSGKVLSLYILVADSYDSVTSILGYAYRNTSICLFGKDIFLHSGGIGQVSRMALETGVLEHEMGHLFGLVNLNTPMVTPHEDPDHKVHCNNKNCLMYYAMETNAALNLSSGAVPVLDSNCRNDLRGNGGK